MASNENLGHVGKEGEYVGDAKKASLGDAITYMFAIFNTGTTTVSSLELEDDKVSVTKTCVDANLMMQASRVYTQSKHARNNSDLFRHCGRRKL